MAERLTRRERRQIARALAKNKGSQETTIPNWIAIEGAEALGAQRVQEAIRGALRWTSRYGELGYPLIIRPVHETDISELPDSQRPAELASSGLIMLDPSQLDRYNIDAYSAVLHAMTHASQPPHPTRLQEPLPFFTGYSRNLAGHIVEYHGLRVTLRLRGEDREQYFTRFEEGMAERNASFFPEYRWTGKNYYAWGVLTRANFPFDRFPNAHKLAQKNDVPSFVRTVLHVPPNIPISGNHIAKAMLLYTNAWNG